MLIHRPAVYEHAAALIGCRPDEAMADAGLLYRAHQTAQQRYDLRHVVVALDIYGADCAAVASAAGRNLDDPAYLADLAATPADAFPAGPQQNILAAAGRLRHELDGAVVVQVPVTAGFSLAAKLAGFETVLMGLLDDPSAVDGALDAMTDAQARYIQAVAETGCGVTIYESAASPPLVRPDDFRSLVLPRLARLADAARQATGRPPELIMGGATAPVIGDLLALSPSLVLCDELDKAGEFLAAARAVGVDLRVNLPANHLLPDHRVTAHHELEQLGRLTRGGPDAPPLYVATGVIPFDADPGHVAAFSEIVEQINQAV